MNVRFGILALAAFAGALLATPVRSFSAPLLAMDFGDVIPNSPLQTDFQGMWGTSDAISTATIGPYTIELQADSSQTEIGAQRGFFNKVSGRINSTDASIRDFYRDFYYNRSTVNGEGIKLKIAGLTPNTPYNLTLVSFDPDASAAVPTVTNWGPASGSNTTGTSTTINMLREPVPTTLWDPMLTGTVQVSTTTGIFDIFGTTSGGTRGAVLNGFKLDDGTNDLLVVDFGEGAPGGNVEPGFTPGFGTPSQASFNQSVGAYTVSLSFGEGFWNEIAAGGAAILPSNVHAIYRDYYYNNSTATGDGVVLTIDGVTPNTDYDVTLWSYDPANASPTPTEWSPLGATTGTTGTIEQVRTPAPISIHDPQHSTTIRVRSTGTTLEIFGTTTAGTGGTRLNAFELNAVPTAVPGDFDGDGDVDGADFVVWQTNFPTETGATLATGDADGDGDVDGADFVIWQTNFPFTPSGGVAPVPEPASILLALGGIIALARRKLRR